MRSNNGFTVLAARDRRWLCRRNRVRGFGSMAASPFTGLSRTHRRAHFGAACYRFVITQNGNDVLVDSTRRHAPPRCKRRRRRRSKYDLARPHPYAGGCHNDEQDHCSSYLGSVLITVLRGRRPDANRNAAIDDVFVIMMENHGFGQIMDNPNRRMLTLAGTASLATNYFAIAHPIDELPGDRRRLQLRNS